MWCHSAVILKQGGGWEVIRSEIGIKLHRVVVIIQGPAQVAENHENQSVLGASQIEEHPTMCHVGRKATSQRSAKNPHRYMLLK